MCLHNKKVPTEYQLTNSAASDLWFPLYVQRIAPPSPTLVSTTKPHCRSQRILDLGILTANPCPISTPAHKTHSHVQHHTITQEAILACMNTYSYITSRSLTPANATRPSLPVKILNAVLDMDTGTLLEIQHLLVDSKYTELWGNLYTTKLGCLVQDTPGVKKRHQYHCIHCLQKNLCHSTQGCHIWAGMCKLLSGKG